MTNSRRRARPLWLLVAGLAACTGGSTNGAPPTVPASADPQATSPELLGARAKLAAYEAVPLPPYSGTGTMADFMKGTLIPWMNDAMARWGVVARAYRVAYDAAKTPDAKMAVIGELLDAAERNVARVSTGPDAALPPASRNDPATLDMIHRMASDRIAPVWLGPIVDVCVASAAELHVDGGVAKRCRDLATGFADAKKPATHETATDDGKGAVPTHSWIATQHADRCSFAGSVSLAGEALYGDAKGATSVATARADVEVERLELPATAGGRYKATLSWPVHGTVWIRAEAQYSRCRTS